MNPALGPIILLAAAILLALLALNSVRTGRVLWHPALLEFHRHVSPGAFWAIVVAYVVAALALAGTGLAGIVS